MKLCGEKVRFGGVFIGEQGDLEPSDQSRSHQNRTARIHIIQPLKRRHVTSEHSRIRCWICMGALGRCASVFLYWRTSQVRQCILACFRFFCLTSFVHIFFIRTLIYANSDSISRIFPRRTQWRNPFPLFLLLKINYTLIFNSYVYRKYGVLQKCCNLT